MPSITTGDGHQVVSIFLGDFMGKVRQGSEDKLGFLLASYKDEAGIGICGACLLKCLPCWLLKNPGLSFRIYVKLTK